MKSIVILIFSLLNIISLNAQVINSSCYTNDSVFISEYRWDAARLALRNINSTGSVYADSITIPQGQIDTIFQCLTSLYNASSIPAIDTIFNMIHIRTFEPPFIRQLSICTDISNWWANNLLNGNPQSGEPLFDNLVQQYNLIISDVSAYSSFSTISIILESADPVNIDPLKDLFNAVSGVLYTGYNPPIGDANDILFTPDTDHYEFIFDYGFGDCFSGCIDHHYWKLWVYPGCNVELKSSYGDMYNSVSEREFPEIRIYPTLTSDIINVEINDQTDHYIYLYDLSGKIYEKYEKNTGFKINLAEYNPGLYFLKDISTNNSATYKIIKR